MSRSRGRLIAVLLATLVLLAGANLAAYAANGGPLLLGKGNKATKTTTLKSSKGTALSLKSKTGTAPLKVSNSTTVASLSADLLDGQDGEAYRNRTFTYTISGSSTAADTAWALPNLPPGKYLVSYSFTLFFSATPTSVFCFVGPASGSIARVTAATNAVAQALTRVSGSGYIDTTTDAFVVGCDQVGGGTMNASLLPQSRVVLTRVDDVTSGTAGPPGPYEVNP